MDLVGNNLNLWYNLVAQVTQLRLNNLEDKFSWGLHQNGIFAVKFIYGSLIFYNRLRYNMII
jgi:hypothetical protein